MDDRDVSFFDCVPSATKLRYQSSRVNSEQRHLLREHSCLHGPTVRSTFTSAGPHVPDVPPVQLKLTVLIEGGRLSSMESIYISRRKVMSHCSTALINTLRYQSLRSNSTKETFFILAIRLLVQDVVTNVPLTQKFLKHAHHQFRTS